MQVKRAFTQIADGQVHYRTAGKPNGGVPLVMLHPGPTSSHAIAPLIARLGEHRYIVAPDLMGMGDSDGPTEESPDMGYFAAAVYRFLDKMGIERFDLWGSMTGAHCAIEMSLMKPERPKRLYIELVHFYDESTRAALQANHAPKVTIDQIGSQINLLWHLARDQHIFFPWFARDGAHRRPTSLPTADQLHEKVVELLKACRTYHKALNAALRYPTAERLKKVQIPVFGPEHFKELLPNVTVRGAFCVGPSTAKAADVDAAAKEILRHLAA
ncbi:MAG: alpha/beta fold hydrolase [Alphaproteobacteria bacterium]|nr:alpha/beta fold hydrolase [Alphaproteobacteria bacterium]